MQEFWWAPNKCQIQNLLVYEIDFMKRGSEIYYNEEVKIQS